MAPYVDLVAPSRQALHSYCRRLTRNLWDAEGLVQDTLLRAFGNLGRIHNPIANPRAYLFRTATHVWIDRLRRREVEAALHRGKRSWFEGSLGGHPEWPVEGHPEAERAERGLFRGEPIVLFFRTRRGREALEAVFRLAEEEGHVCRILSYGFCPETMRVVGEELGLRVRTGIYRAPTPAPGRYYGESGESGGER